MSYRVELEAFSGPMDLLLHLVKRQEVNIHDISISEILRHFLTYLKALETLDLNNIGDFVVMATTLMEIKSKELLPKQEVDLGEELDPRDELIRQLLEYRRYRELTRRLDRHGKWRERLMSRGTFGADSKEIRELADEERARELEESLDLEDLDVWFLLKAYSRLLEETKFGNDYEVQADKKPISIYIDELVGRLAGGSKEAPKVEPPETPFQQVFDLSQGKMGVIGCFMALLELLKQGRLVARQTENFGEIYLRLATEDELAEAERRQAEFEAEAARRAAATNAAKEPEAAAAETDAVTTDPIAGSTAEPPDSPRSAQEGT